MGDDFKDLLNDSWKSLHSEILIDLKKISGKPNFKGEYFIEDEIWINILVGRYKLQVYAKGEV